MSEQHYDASDITILEGLEAVRLRPGMYIGSTGKSGLHHILWEIVDNAIDEAANGFADKIDVHIYKDNSVSVEDNGRGIPTDIHPKMKVSGVQVVFTQLHAGGKFDEHNYSFSGGLHGVGASVTNALSKWLNVRVCRDGKTFEMGFKSYYDPKKKKYESGIPTAPLTDVKKKTKKHGTFVHFLPDDAVFGDIAVDTETVNRRLKELAYLNKGVTITLTDDRITMNDMAEGDGTEEGGTMQLGIEGTQPYSVTYRFDGGISDFVSALNENKETLYRKPLAYLGEKDGVIVEFAIQHTTDFTESLFSFVNNIPTPEGGTHESGFRSGITRVLNAYARDNKLIKDKDGFVGDDFREGLNAVISVKMKNVQFEGQTKTKLGNPEVRTIAESVTVEGLKALSSDPKNKKSFDEIIKKAQGAACVLRRGRPRIPPAPRTASIRCSSWGNFPPARGESPNSTSSSSSRGIPRAAPQNRRA